MGRWGEGGKKEVRGRCGVGEHGASRKPLGRRVGVGVVRSGGGCGPVPLAKAGVRGGSGGLPDGVTGRRRLLGDPRPRLL